MGVHDELMAIVRGGFQDTKNEFGLSDGMEYNPVYDGVGDLLYRVIGKRPAVG